MDVHLHPAEQQIAVRALVTVRNDGKSPLAHIPLQISSSLNWERIRIADHDAAYHRRHAQLRRRPHRPAPRGRRPARPAARPRRNPPARRHLLRRSSRNRRSASSPSEPPTTSPSTPTGTAIGVDFTGLRGFGNVVWYPVSSVPVILGDGARVFDEMGEHKLRMAGAHFRLRLTVEFPHGHAPTVALINGHPAPLTVTEPDTGGGEVSGVATASLDERDPRL